MNKSAVMVFLSLVLASAGAEAATPKRPPTYNQNRIGPYAVGIVGMTNYPGDQSFNETLLLGFMTRGSPSRNLAADSDDSGFGYQAQFGYRFFRYMAAELGLVKFGDLKTNASGDVDYDGDGDFTPVTSSFRYRPNGLLMSAVGILPIGTRVELFGRVGYLFTNVEREISIKSDDTTLLSGRFRDDTQEVVYGVGLTFNFNQVYSLRAEYQLAEDMGTAQVGSEDLNFLSLGFLMRF